jgi:hypothetical protein
MSRLPIAIGSSAFASVTLGCVAFIMDSGRIASPAAAMIVFGLLLVTLGGLAGLILTRAPWSRWVLGVTIITAILLASISGSPLFWIALGVGTFALIGLTGPWLTLWVRQQPPADRLGIVPMSLIASGGITPIVVGFAAYEEVAPIHWALVGVVVVCAWAYGRGLMFGIWGFRLLVLPFALLAGLQTAEAGSVIIVLGALLIATMSWSPQAGRVTAVITPPLPAPASRVARPKEPGDATR